MEKPCEKEMREKMKRIKIGLGVILFLAGIMRIQVIANENEKLVITATKNENLFWEPVEPEDYGKIIIPKDIFPEGNGLPIPIYVPAVINGSNATLEESDWKNIKEVSKDRVKFVWARLYKNLIMTSPEGIPENPSDAAISLAYWFLKAASEAFEKDGFKITIQKNPQGDFRAIIQILMDEGNAVREQAGSAWGVSSPATGAPAVAWSRYLQERFSLPDAFGIYRSSWIFDKKHKQDPYIAYLSLFPKNDSIVITPIIYPKDCFKIMKDVTSLGGPIVLELRGQEYVAAWRYPSSASPQELKVLELLPLVPVQETRPSSKPELQITSSLRIFPQKPSYEVGQTITAEFSIKNKGLKPVILDVLTVGGRLNESKTADFDWQEAVNLQPNVPYKYKGKLLLKSPGKYHFFTAYRTKDGQWNTAIPTAQGVTNTKDIKVETSIPVKVEPNKLTGSVKDQHGKPVENAAVWLSNFTLRIGFSEKERGYSRTNQAGYFKMDTASIPEADYTLRIIKGIDYKGEDFSHWYALKRTDLYEPYKREISITKKAKAEGVFLGTITFRKWYRIIAKVVDKSGSPYQVSWGVYEPDSSTPSSEGWRDEIQTLPLPDGVYRLKLWAHPIGWKLPEKPIGWESTEKEVIISGSDVDLGEIVIPNPPFGEGKYKKIKR